MAAGHDLGKGADRLALVEGMLWQTSAEVWASCSIISNELALLTAFHHARSIYEIDVLLSWLLRNFDSNAMRLVKEGRRQRLAFENSATGSFWDVQSDVTEDARNLVKDKAVRGLPTVEEMARDDLTLAADVAFLWRYASSFIHAGRSYTAAIQSANERQHIMHIYFGILRHAALIYARVIHYWHLPLTETVDTLRKIELYVVDSSA